MIRAWSPTGDGGHLILLGLSDGNLERLRRREPILVELGELNEALAGVRVSIMWGPNEDAMEKELRLLGIEIHQREDRR